MNCRVCGKSFNRGFIRRHESEYCPLQDHMSSIKSDSDQGVGIGTKKNMGTLTTAPQEVMTKIKAIPGHF